MPKSIVVEPKEVFSKSAIRLSDIPINAYDRALEDEQSWFRKFRQGFKWRLCSPAA